MRGGHAVTRKRYRIISKVVTGVLLKVGRQFVCWDSFKAGWYLGPRRLAEVFPYPFFEGSKFERRTAMWDAVQLLYPTARRVDYP